MLLNAATTTTTTVVTSICKFILMDRINSCRLVCKDWASLFDRYRWRYIEFNIPCLDLGPKGEILDNFLGPSSLEAVRKNSNRIRTLGVKAQDLVQLLLLENDQGQYHCGNDNNDNNGRTPLLSNTRCLNIDFSEIHASTDINDVNGAFKFVVRRTSRHQILSFTKLFRTSQGFDFSLLASFATHSTLTVLQIASHRASDQRLVFAILKNTPPCLRKRQFESLRILSVNCQYGVCESWVHHPILKNAPLLKYLKTGCYVDIEDEDNDITDFAGYRHTLVVVSTACPEIQHLHVQYGGWDPVITAAELVSLIQAYPKGLEALNFEMPESGQEEVISALLNSSASTLKSVVIEHYPNIPPVSKEAVARMVEECPQLEELT
ncbi:hypothetical protein BGZ89_009721 [Linnemannia elongata]|nr:hypothetical protein BGZ89_009721 [Linnemannia elongata]